MISVQEALDRTMPAIERLYRARAVDEHARIKLKAAQEEAERASRELHDAVAEARQITGLWQISDD